VHFSPYSSQKLKLKMILNGDTALHRDRPAFLLANSLCCPYTFTGEKKKKRSCSQLADTEMLF